MALGREFKFTRVPLKEITDISDLGSSFLDPKLHACTVPNERLFEVYPYEVAERIRYARWLLERPYHLRYVSHQEDGGDVLKTRLRVIKMLNPNWKSNVDDQGSKGRTDDNVDQ